MTLARPHLKYAAPINTKNLYSAIGSAQSVKLGLASNPESSSAWVKTIIDPAHAREYSCRGIPDENQDPTLVYYGRDTLTLTTEFFASLTDKTVYWSGGSWVTDSSIKGHVFTDIYVIQTGLVTNNIVLIAVGNGTRNTQTVPVCCYLPITDSTGVGIQDTVRLVAQSLTVSWSGKEIDRGGLFEAGYLPYSTTSSAGSDSACTNLDNFSNYATYTGSSDDGCYIIGRFNQYDMYKWWKTQGMLEYFIQTNSGKFKVPVSTEYVSPTAWGSWRPSVVRYITNGNTDWLLRVTYNTVVELMKPYNAGGTDGAVYDMASVQDVIAIYDSLNLIFPARFNDFKKVLAWLKNHGPKAVALTASLLRHFPRTRRIAQALDLLVGYAPRSSSGPQSGPTIIEVSDAIVPVKTSSTRTKKKRGSKRRR